MTKENRFKELMDRTQFGSMKFDKVDQLAVMREIREKQNQVQKKKKKTGIPAVILSTIAAAAILFILIMQLPLKNQIEAGLTKPATLLSQSNDPGLVAWSKKNDPQQVNKTSESSGIKVSIKEIMFDGYRMAIGYEVQSKTKLVGPVHNPKITVNGKVVSVTEISKSVETDIKVFRKGTHSFKGVTSLFIKEKLPEKFEVKMQFFGNQNPALAPKASATTKGKWEYSIPVEKKGDVYTIKPKGSVTKGSTTLSVDQIILAPSVTEISFAKEENGKRLPAVEGVEYRLLDDKENLLSVFGNMRGSGEEKDGKFILRSNRTYAPADGIPSYLTVQPFIDNDFETNPNKGQMTMKKLNDPLPMTFPQQNGAILVNKIEESKDKKRVKIYYEVKGDLPEVRGSHINLAVKEPKEEKDFFVDQNFFKNMRSNDRKKIAEFITDDRKDLYLTVPNINPVLYKDLELKIPIKKEDLIKK